MKIIYLLYTNTSYKIINFKKVKIFIEKIIFWKILILNCFIITLNELFLLLPTKK